MLQAQVDLLHRALEVGERARLVHAGVERARRRRRRRPPRRCSGARRATGSGRRRRHTPGTTRSPRPSSRLRAAPACGHDQRPRLVTRRRRMAATDETTSRSRATRSRRGATARDGRGRSALLRRARRARPRRDGRAAGSRGRSTGSYGDRRRSSRRTACATTSPRLFAAFPDFELRGRRHASTRATRPCAGARTGHLRRPRPLPGHRAHRRAPRPRGHRPPDRRATAARPQRRLHRRHDDRPPARACCRRRTRPTEQRMTKAVNARHALACACSPARPSRSPTACGSCAAASRARRFNVYFVREGDGVRDVRRRASRTMANAARRPAAPLGGITRIVLGHGARRPPRRRAGLRASPSTATPTTSPTPRATAAALLPHRPARRARALAVPRAPASRGTAGR